MDIKINDGLFRSRIVSHEATGEVGHIMEQTNRNIILERNNELRKNPGALRDLTFGRQVANIPFEDWDYFIEKNPNFRLMNGKERQKALMDFLKFDPRGQACCVQDTEYKHQKYF